MADATAKGLVVATCQSGEPHGITDGDTRSLARNHAALLEFSKGTRHQFPHRAEASRELSLRERELDRHSRPDRLAETRCQIASQPLTHRPKGEVADDAGEMTDPAGQSLEYGDRHRWAALTQTKYLGARQDQYSCRYDRYSRGDVPTSIEERPFPERGSSTFRMEYLFAASEGDLPDLDASVSDDEQAATRLPLFEEGFPRGQSPHRALLSQPSQFGGGQGSEIRDSPQSLGHRSFGIASPHDLSTFSHSIRRPAEALP